MDLRAKEIHGGVSRQGKYKKSFDLQHYACMNIYTEQGFLRIIQEIWMEIDSRGITYRNMSERLLIMPIQYKLLQCNYVFYWTYHGNWGKNIYLVFYSIQQSGALANLHVIRKHLFWEALPEPSGRFTGVMLSMRRMGGDSTDKCATQEMAYAWVKNGPGMFN